LVAGEERAIMLEWPDATIYRGIEGVASAGPDRTALVFEEREIAYNELLAESRALASGLADLGVGPGDRVAVWLGNRPAWITAQLAASYLGAAVVAVNTRYRTHELAYMLEDSGCSVVLTEESFLGYDYLEMLSEVVPEIESEASGPLDSDDFPALDHVLAVKGNEAFPAIRAYDAVMESGRDADTPAPDTDAGSAACVFYTSGTTGDPKGCLQPDRSLLNHGHQVGVHLGADESDVVLGVLPFPGIWGHNVFMSALAHGATLVVQPHVDPREALDLIDEYDVTYVPAMATIFERIMAGDGFDPKQVASVKRGTVAFLNTGFDEALFERIESAFGFQPIQPYGLSEANSQVFVGDPADPADRRKQVGGPLIHPDAEAKVVDPETREPLDRGEAGELCLRGYNVMNGYLGRPEATDRVFEADGWLATGDLVTRDEDDYLYYQSRLDDALRVRGFLVTPRNIETVVDDHPGVELSQVVGAPHPRHGQVPVAFVKRSDPGLTAEALRSALEGTLADYKIPDPIHFVESFPRSEGPHGAKIRREELRDRVADRYADE
jgi:fatty-acyl-CoA synthase